MHHLGRAEIVVCKCFQFGQVKILSSSIGLKKGFKRIISFNLRIDIFCFFTAKCILQANNPIISESLNPFHLTKRLNPNDTQPNIDQMQKLSILVSLRCLRSLTTIDAFLQMHLPSFSKSIGCFTLNFLLFTNITQRCSCFVRKVIYIAVDGFVFLSFI